MEKTYYSGKENSDIHYIHTKKHKNSYYIFPVEILVNVVHNAVTLSLKLK